MPTTSVAAMTSTVTCAGTSMHISTPGAGLSFGSYRLFGTGPNLNQGSGLPYDQGTTAAVGTITVTGPNNPNVWTDVTVKQYDGVGFTLRDTIGDVTCGQTVSPSDTTAPVITPAVTGTLGTNGWYTSNVAVGWSVVDNESTITGQTGCGSSTVNTDTTGVTFSCAATSAGGSNQQSVTIKRDAANPTTTATPIGTAGSNGWYTSAVSVTLAGSDATAGVARTEYKLDTAGWTAYSTSTPVTVAGNGTHTLLSRSMDAAGNQESSQTLTIKIDTDAPTNVAGTPARSADRDGWYNHAVAVTFAGQDATSGIASCTQGASYGGPDSAAASVTGTCTDNAGNTTTSTFALKYDATAPTNVVGTPDRAPNPNGWYNAPVNATFAGQDATSGIASCTVGSYSGPDSAAASANGSCTDNAGNTANGSFALKYDATKPVVTYTGNAGTYTPDQTVNIVCTPADNLSGIASSTCQNITGPAYRFALGANPYSATATDNAGNVGNATSTSFTVRATAGSVGNVIGQFVTDPSVAASLKDMANQIATAPNAGAKQNKLNAFISLVNAQTGKSITPQQAATLITLAKAL